MRSNQREFFTDPAKLAEGFLFSQFFWDPEPADGKVLSQEHIDNCCFILRYWRGEFYRYDGKRYRRLSEEDLKCRITGHLRKLNEQAGLTDDPAEQVRITSQTVNNILLCIKGTEGVYMNSEREEKSWDTLGGMQVQTTYSFTNGLVMISPESETIVTGEGDPRFFTRSYFPYPYDERAKCPQWLEFLEEVMEADAERIKLLQQWAGYLITKTERNYQKFLLIAGEGQNGKTVFTTIMEKLAGEDNVTHIPISRFGDRFALSATLGKVLNSSSEASHRLDEKAEMILKSYTSGDRMTFDRKFREPISAYPTAKVMISTNQLPAFADKSLGIWRRMLFVPFEKNIPEHRQRPELAQMLQRELSGIFNWAYQGLLELRKAGGFIQPAKSGEAIEKYRRDVNPARSFLLENYTFSLEYEGLPCREVYRSYVNFCERNGYRPLNASNFGKEVQRCFTGVKKRRERVSGRRLYRYTCLAVQENSEVATAYNDSCPRWS